MKCQIIYAVPQGLTFEGRAIGRGQVEGGQSQQNGSVLLYAEQWTTTERTQNNAKKNCMHPMLQLLCIYLDSADNSDTMRVPEEFYPFSTPLCQTLLLRKSKVFC